MEGLFRSFRESGFYVKWVEGETSLSDFEGHVVSLLVLHNRARFYLKETNPILRVIEFQQSRYRETITSENGSSEEADQFSLVSNGLLDEQ